MIVSYWQFFVLIIDDQAGSVPMVPRPSSRPSLNTLLLWGRLVSLQQALATALTYICIAFAIYLYHICFVSNMYWNVLCVFLFRSALATMYFVVLYQYLYLYLCLCISVPGRLGNQLSSLASMISFSGWWKLLLSFQNFLIWEYLIYISYHQVCIWQYFIFRTIWHEGSCNKISGKRFARLKWTDKKPRKNEKNKPSGYPSVLLFWTGEAGLAGQQINQYRTNHHCILRKKFNKKLKIFF